MLDFKLKWYDWILIILFGHPLITLLWGIIFGIIGLLLGEWIYNHIDINWE